MAIAKVVLTKLSQAYAIVDNSGRPVAAFLRYFNDALTQIQNAFNGIIDAQNAADAAQDSADAAAADAATAVTEAGTATTTANTAITNAAAAQSTANAASAAVTAETARAQAAEALLAPLASPVFTGDPKAPTPPTADNDTSIATTAYVQAQGYLTSSSAGSTYALINSPVLTGDPKAPTPATADNDTSIATTAFVQANLTGYVQTPVAWTAYTPTLSAFSGTLTTASATGRWYQVGKLVFFWVEISITTNGSAAGYVAFTLPVNAKSNSVAAGYEGAVNGSMIQARLPAGGNVATILFYNNTYPGANGSLLRVAGSYEAA